MLRKYWAKFGRDYQFLVLGWFFLGITLGLYDSSFNNYLNDIFHLSAKMRSLIEFPRELPGFLVVFITGLLVLIPDVRMLGVALGMIGVGLLGQSCYLWQTSPSFNWMVFSMLIWSFGTHLSMPYMSSLPLKYAKEGRAGEILGKLSGVNTTAYILGCGLIWLLMGWLHLSYDWVFRIAALSAFLAAGYILMIPVTEKKSEKKFELIFRKEYTLFYCLSILFGARKQVFLTFAPWVLVKIYHQPATIIATLLLFSAVLGIVFKPWLGRMIDWLGERQIIICESAILVLICLAYGWAGHLGLKEYVVDLVYLCFIMDQLLLAVTMARTTYLHKNLVVATDLTPTLSLGISMDHVVSMFVPILGGLLWESYGYEIIFLAAAGVALLNLVVATRIRAIKEV